ncbi:MAG: flagellar hook-basal body complex protein [Vannielia sp.]|uniref:flagellar hook-basal body complex protein n=1 Tax=Rhodobacterales TaxID=204455 RepID=UPI002095FD7C|nr:flagellar hook-basal body complex protein [Oceanicola sp. 502str15]MCO6384765.1 flagellar hook-basal body complex protein [Oceanicola sp. 502str15]
MSSTYVTLSRQSGLMNEMRAVANNLANLSTTGFRREGVIFSEWVRAADGPSGSVSMATARVRNTDLAQGTLSQTGGTFDFAIEGEGFFQIETPQGLRLTRAGSYTPGPAGEVMNGDGHFLLDAGGAPVFAPPGARSISLAADGTLSADGVPLTQIGMVEPEDYTAMTREGGTLFDPGGAVVPAENARVLQGFIEESNVDPILEIARMIEVQRTYELGQKFLEKESERKDSVIQTLTR